MCVAAIACQVAQSKPGKSGWNLWGLRISRGLVHTCLQICGALLWKKWGWKWKSAFVLFCHPVCNGRSLTEKNLKQDFPPDVSWWLYSPFCHWGGACCVSFPQRWELFSKLAAGALYHKQMPHPRLLNHPAAIENWLWTCSGWGHWKDTTLLL